MNRSLLLLTVFTAAVVTGAYAYNIKALDFPALICIVVFLYKCCQAINLEWEDRQARAEREARRLVDEEDEHED